MYKGDRRNAVRDRIVDAEVKKLEIRQTRMREAGARAMSRPRPVRHSRRGGALRVGASSTGAAPWSPGSSCSSPR